MPNEDGRGIDSANDARIVLYDRLELQSFEHRRVRANLLHFLFQAWPRWRENRVARLLIPIDPLLPASRRQPQSMNQNNRRLGGTSICAHCVIPRRRDGRTNLVPCRSVTLPVITSNSYASGSGWRLANL